MMHTAPPPPSAVPLPPQGPVRRALGACTAALSSTAAHAPENAAYGLMALAPLGAALGPTAMGLALLGAAVSSAIASTLGGGRLAGDAGAALALLTTGLVAALASHLPGSGSAEAWLVIALVAVGIASAGLLQVMYGALRLGGLVKYTPYPVRAGLATGVGLLLIGGAAPALAGHGFAAGWSGGEAVQWGAVLVGAAAMAVTFVAARRRTTLPPLLLGLATATALQAAIAAAGGAHLLAPAVGVPTLPGAWFGGAPTGPALLAALADPKVLALLAAYAATASVIASLDTLLAASVVDGTLRRTRDANRELMAQGLGNLGSAAVGGLPVSPSLPASLGLVLRQPDQRHIVLVFAGALLAVLLVAPVLLGVLPTSAVAGVLIVLGLSMVSRSLWRTPRQAWRVWAGRAGTGRPRDRRWRVLAADWAVTVIVALCAVTLGIGPAVLVGASCAVLLFVRANMRDVVRRVWTGDRRHSLRARPPHVADELRRHGRGILVLELQGALFFGTADALRERLDALAPAAETAILDLHQVSELDATAARILTETAADWERMGKPLVFAEWPAHDARRGLIESVAHEAGGPAPRFEDHVDRALEQAEERVLHRLPLERQPGGELALSDTILARGLTGEELAVLAAEMSLHRFAQGELLFRAGDPGDRLYISLQGEIGLRIPGTARRLASFAPGVTIGEMGLLALEPRSLEAIAETEVTALGMSVASFDRLLQTHPGLVAKMLRNIALHLGDRVRHLTNDLAAWVSRTGAGRPGGD